MAFDDLAKMFGKPESFWSSRGGKIIKDSFFKNMQERDSNF